MYKTEDLESLLNRETYIDDAIEKKKEEEIIQKAFKYKPGGTAKKLQTAKKNANLSDCIRMIGMIVDFDLKKYNVEFTSNEHQIKIRDPEIPFNHPYISYKVISRKPSNEYKPVIREEVNECDLYSEQRGGAIFGQTFDCILQFNIFAAESAVADEIMEKFEELILNYTGYLKNEGVAEIYFKEQITDSDYNNFRETLSVKNIRYYVKIDKLMVIFNRRLDDIDINGVTVDFVQDEKL